MKDGAVLGYRRHQIKSITLRSTLCFQAPPTWCPLYLCLCSLLRVLPRPMCTHRTVLSQTKAPTAVALQCLVSPTAAWAVVPDNALKWGLDSNSTDLHTEKWEVMVPAKERLSEMKQCWLKQRSYRKFAIIHLKVTILNSVFSPQFLQKMEKAIFFQLLLEKTILIYISSLWGTGVAKSLSPHPITEPCRSLSCW